MASVLFKHIYKRFPGGVTAVSDFDLDIKDKAKNERVKKALSFI